MNRKLKNQELNRLSIADFKTTDKTPIVVVLDNIRSLNNIGSVFRTADAFLVESIYLCGITAQPPHRDIQKTALGATESVHWQYFSTTEEAVDALKNKDYQILAIEQAENTIALNEFHPPKGQKLAIVLGNEVNGVTQEVVNMADQCLEIPQWGTKHSLNISVCAGVVIWDLFQKVSV